MLQFTISPCLRSLWPLAVGRPLSGLAMAGRTLREWQESVWPDQAPDGCWQNEDAWVSGDDVAALAAAGPGHVLVDAGGHPMAGWNTPGAGMATLTLPAGGASFRLLYPWDLLKLNEILVGGLTESRVHGEVSAGATIEGTLVLGEGSRVLPGVYIEGKVIIGRGCKIGPNCYLRGSTSIGDHCHIGQSVEIKNCLIGHKTNIGHLSYVGDSVLGDGVNFGAGTTTSNLRHDGLGHRSMVDGKLIDTGRRKFGAIVGDGVHTGIHTSLYPGRKLGPGATTRPGEVVQRDLPGRRD